MMEDDSNVAQFVIPLELCEMGDVMEGDVRDLVGTIFNDLANLQDRVTEGFSMKKKMSTPDLDSIFYRIEKYSEMKKKLKEEAVGAFKRLHEKWIQSLLHVQEVMIEKIETIVDESTLRTSDFNDNSISITEPCSPKKKNGRPIAESSTVTSTSISSREFLGQSDSKISKRKRSLASTPPDYSTSTKRTCNSLMSSWKAVESSSEEEEAIPKHNPVIKGNPRAVGRRSILKSNVEDVSGYISEEENISKYLRTPRKSVGFCSVVEMEQDKEYSSEEESNSVYSPIKTETVISSPASPISRRTRRSGGRASSTPKPKERAATLTPVRKAMRNTSSPTLLAIKVDKGAVVTMKKLTTKNIASPMTSNSAKNFALDSCWIPLNSASNAIPSDPAMYQIKVNQAKKPAFIGMCANLHVQLLKFQNGESTGQKQLDKFLERNRDNVQIMSQVFDSQEMAEESQKSELENFHESFQKYPVFNIA